MSNVLTAMGIRNDNEIVLEHGYRIDIFVPLSIPSQVSKLTKITGNLDLNSRGIIIEYDGPRHFESFLNVRQI